MNHQLRTSIIVVNYNNRQGIHRALTSIRENNPDLYREIIIVDNNSEDGSQQFIKDNLLDSALVENKGNVGFGRANNQATRMAVGEYFLFANPDIRVVGGKIAEMVKFMEDNPRAGLLGPRIIWPDERVQVSAAEFSRLGWAVGHHLHLKNIFPQEMLRKALAPLRKFLGGAVRSYLFVYEDKKEPRQVDWLTGAFLMVRKSVFEELGGFDEDYFLYFEDQDLALRAKQKGYESYYFPSVVVEHAVGSSMKKTPRALIEKYRSELMFWIKHYSPASLLALRTLMGVDFSLRWFFTFSKARKKIYGQILHYVFASRKYILKTSVKL